MRGTIDSRLLTSTLLASTTLFAQTAPPGRIKRETSQVIATPYNALRSPEVNADRTVTLRFRAPEATAVDLVGEITLGHRAITGLCGGQALTIGLTHPDLFHYVLGYSAAASG